MNRFLRRNTSDRLRRMFSPSVLIPWNRETLSDLVTQCDLAIIPVPIDSPLEEGKPENKLLLFWRMGMPVVTSATTAYQEAMQQAGLQMACRTSEDWERTLEYYLRNEAARRDAGERGRQFAESHWSEQSMVHRWDQVMLSLFPSLHMPESVTRDTH
jgi:glycosyltransferase involved in cell wall biosynthesis